MDQIISIARGWLPVIVGIAVQTAGIVWWASNLTAKVSQMAQLQESQAKTIAALVDNAHDTSDRLTKVQTIQQELLKFYDPYLKEKQR